MNTKSSTVVDVDAEVADLVPEYLVEVRDGIEEMRRHLAAEDLPSARRIAHNIAGTGGSFGFDQLTIICRNIEFAADRLDATTMRGALAELSQYMAGLEVRYPAQTAQIS